MAKEAKVKKEDFDVSKWASYRKNKDGTLTGLIPMTKPVKSRVGLSQAQLKKAKDAEDAKKLADAQELVKNHEDSQSKNGVK